MSQSVHADFLPDTQSRRPVTPDCLRRPSNACEDNYASLGRQRPLTALATTRSRAAGAEEFYLQVGMQVLCTGELGEWWRRTNHDVTSRLILAHCLSGILRYIGPVDFTDGIWLGVELRGPHGRHDGAVAGRRYFTCPANHGVLVRPSRVTFRGINAAKLLPPGLAATYEKPRPLHTRLSDTRSVHSHP